MILLRQDQSNKITVTLNELKNENLPNNWLFVFDNAQSDTYQYKIQLTDESLSTERYNLFTLIEGTDLNFTFLGDYSYYVFQMPNEVSVDPEDGELVETGIMRLIESTQTEIPTYIVDSNTNIYDKNNI
jgi:hypothetical protein